MKRKDVDIFGRPSLHITEIPERGHHFNTVEDFKFYSYAGVASSDSGRNSVNMKRNSLVLDSRATHSQG